MAQRLLLNIRENFERRRQGGADADADDPSGDGELGSGAGTDTLAFSDLERSLAKAMSTGQDVSVNGRPSWCRPSVDVSEEKSGKGGDGDVSVEMSEADTRVVSCKRKDKGKGVCRDGDGDCARLLDTNLGVVHQTSTTLSGTTAASPVSPTGYKDQKEGMYELPSDDGNFGGPVAGPSRLSGEDGVPQKVVDERT